MYINTLHPLVGMRGRDPGYEIPVGERNPYPFFYCVNYRSEDSQPLGCGDQASYPSQAQLANRAGKSFSVYTILLVDLRIPPPHRQVIMRIVKFIYFSQVRINLLTFFLFGGEVLRASPGNSIHE